MAIAKIKKIELIGLQEDKDSLLALLQNLGSIELINVEEVSQAAGAQIIPTDYNLLVIEEAVTFLARFREKSGFLSSVVNLKPVIYQRELKEVVETFNWQGLVKELTELRDHLKNLLQHKERLAQEKHLLAPWRKLKIPLDQIHPTLNCAILLGLLPSRDYPDMLESCKQQDINLFCDSLSRDKANVYLAIIYIKKQFERLETILKNYHFNFVVLGRHKGTAEDRLLEINREILVLDGQIQDVKLKIIELSGQQFKLMVVYDYLANINNRQKAEKSLIKQEFTFCLRGWIKHRDIELFQRGIANNFKNIALFVSDPKEDEDIPVILENKQLIQPFEFITQIYGMPKYSELDPTPFLAPFFFLYFGFCVSDVGYGIMLTLISWLALKKFKMGAQGIKFFRLFSYCGISTIVIGALTGSWFGNLFDLLAENSAVFLPLKRLKDSLIVLDPLKEPTKLLGVALCFGIIQVWSGNIVAAIGNIKNRRYMNVILDQGSMIIFLFGLTGLGLIFLNLLDKPWTGLFKYSVLVGTVALILTQGRFEKGVGSKLFYGIYNLYNAFSGYLSDILSYSRLWALGLVTGVMAATINLIALQFGQIISSMMPFVGKAIFLKIIVTAFAIAVIFVLGHAVSFLMNLLGAFVHPLRLQFVEFFSKFFKSGGSTFRPFKGEAKYINIVYK